MPRKPNPLVTKIAEDLGISRNAARVRVSRMSAEERRAQLKSLGLPEGGKPAKPATPRSAPPTLRVVVGGTNKSKSKSQLAQEIHTRLLTLSSEEVRSLHKWLLWEEYL
jgi:hypothetical protein